MLCGKAETGVDIGVCKLVSLSYSAEKKWPTMLSVTTEGIFFLI